MSKPAEAIAFVSSGYLSIQNPTKKKVAFASYSFNISMIFKVLSAPQAASKVRAMTLSSSAIDTEYTGIFREVLPKNTPATDEVDMSVTRTVISTMATP